MFVKRGEEVNVNRSLRVAMMATDKWISIRSNFGNASARDIEGFKEEIEDDSQHISFF